MNHDKQHLAVLRRLIEKEDFKVQLRTLLNQFENMKFVYMAIKEDLKDYAHLEPNEYMGYYWKETQEIGITPSFTICYSYDDSTVTLHSIELT